MPHSPKERISHEDDDDEKKMGINGWAARTFLRERGRSEAKCKKQIT
jgi:hypothetical protein